MTSLFSLFLFHANTLGKGMNTSVLSPAMNKLLSKLDSLASVWQGERKL